MCSDILLLSETKSIGVLTLPILLQYSIWHILCIPFIVRHKSSLLAFGMGQDKSFWDRLGEISIKVAICFYSGRLSYDVKYQKTDYKV